MRIPKKQRQRAPSRRAIQSRERILDAAEIVFADKGFDGATLRQIAERAKTQVGLVHHHGGGKAELFAQTVARRADDLSALRLKMLTARKAAGTLTVEGLLECFVGPYLERAASGDVQWLAYARLVAHVSADPRWRELAAVCFDPTANRFIDEIAALFPDAPRGAIASGFVYTVSAMLAVLTSTWRIETLGAVDPGGPDRQEELVRFCAAGIRANLEGC
ncbi:TetR/AcrR family transcriptional regulator [Sedimentitalea todarodis]|uniref:TetR/AcrR family transcriptional regulator n=1 Tax=Sedimentitalea todarodis TaxID=1631240 RepID=A0ABU3VCN5_9RHOB|nr:TetR/AcrR family transcriptional regulator [Sedimentitalea todarodis]MDU9003936.1 TetR/AcrR family transcriptional regulator [Sedimentitalea todarodis]